MSEKTTDPQPNNTVHTYPDGTQVVGTPPFAKESPAQRVADVAPAARPMAIPPGTPTSGVDPATVGVSGETAEQLAERASQQLTSDVLSGKDPHTPNPTTASDKPQLAGTGNVVRADEIEITQRDLDKIASEIKPEGNVTATKEEKQAAAVQVARETKGVVAAKSSKAKK